MSMFKDWLRKKGYYESFSDGDNPIEKFNFNRDNDTDFAIDQDRTEVDLFKMIIRKYPEETEDFFQTIARRGDSEVLNLLKKLDRNKTPKLSRPPRHPSDTHEIVPSSADSSHNSMGEQD